jgi:ubiquinone/menaquinone biosynthesis C-methylase UbiE
MLENKSKDVERMRKKWDAHAERYDEWYERFQGAVEHYVDLEILKAHLPKDRNSKILDAGGGTGRMALPLAKMGYSVTLCDISPGMLNVAKQKMRRDGVSNRVEILECNVYKLRFADQSFDFVLCWDGKIDAAEELIRVTKKGGRISMFLVNRYGAAINKFLEDPGSALALVRSESSCVYDEEEKYEAVSVEEARELFEKKGIKVIKIYAVCGMLDLLSIPKEIQESRSWDEKFFKQVAEMLLRLSKEPSVKGLSRHLVLYGERI